MYLKFIVLRHLYFKVYSLFKGYWALWVSVISLKGLRILGLEAFHPWGDRLVRLGALENPASRVTSKVAVEFWVLWFRGSAILEGYDCHKTLGRAFERG